MRCTRCRRERVAVSAFSFAARLYDTHTNKHAQRDDARGSTCCKSHNERYTKVPLALATTCGGSAMSVTCTSRVLSQGLILRRSLFGRCVALCGRELLCRFVCDIRRLSSSISCASFHFTRHCAKQKTRELHVCVCVCVRHNKTIYIDYSVVVCV